MARNPAVMTKQSDGTRPASQATHAQDDIDERYLVPALTRGLDILVALANGQRSLTLSEIAKIISVTRSSAYRLLYTLSSLGYLVYESETKSYRLGSGVLKLGFGYLAARDLFEVAMPHLIRLRDRTGWSSHLGELQGRDVVYIARVATRRSISSTVYVGTRLPARRTTMGRMLLSSVSESNLRELYDDTTLAAEKPSTSLEDLLRQCVEDRENGFVVQNSVYEPGIASVAAPIYDVTNHVVAAINISIVALFTSDAELNGALKREVVATAAAISQDLGRHSAAPVRPTKRPRMSSPN
jgi:DNA-binding IclR family transcriptional regulator